MVRKSVSSQGKALCAATKKELLIYVRYPFRIISFLVTSFLWVLEYFTVYLMFSGGKGTVPATFVSYSGTSNVIGFIVLGTIVMLYFDNMTYQIGYALRWEQQTGTLEANFLSPSSPIIVLLGRVFAYDIMSILYIGTIVLFYVLGFGVLPMGDLVLSVTALMLVISMAFGFGLMLASLVIIYKTIDALGGILNQTMRILSGFIYPLAVLPSWAQSIAQIVPLTQAIQVFRGALLSGQDYTYQLSDLAFPLIFSLVLPLLGYMAFKKFERRAKREGGLSGY
ncbi:MAG: ABC transporter permease [Candidatus Bathyarchaeota archaeon]|nr:ABC transporter permease [Candidatus Bathyarchaeota archaeon]